MTADIATTDPDGTNLIWLTRLPPGPSRITGLRWGSAYPGGDTTFQADLWAPPDLSHEALRAGRKVLITAGGAVRWRGWLDEPQRGTPWQISGSGLAAEAKNWAAIDSAGNALNLNNVIDQAITRGLPWSRPASLPTAGSASTGSLSIDDALAQVGKATGNAWALSADGVITMAAPPTAVNYVLAASQPLNPTMTGYATQVAALYQSTSTATAVVTVSDATAIARYGKREQRYDMTGLGVLTAANATSHAQSWLDANLPQPRHTTPLTAQLGQLTTPGGGVVDLATVRAGCRIAIVDVDTARDQLLDHTALSVLIGTVEYDDDTASATFTPVGAAGHDLITALYQGFGGAI